MNPRSPLPARAADARTNERHAGPGGSPTRTAFTLIELLVVVAIIAVLAAIAFPMYQRAALRGRQAQSLSNLHNIGLAVASYLPDNNNTYPAECGVGFVPPFWTQTLAPYLSPAVKGGWIGQDGQPITNSPTLIDPLVANGSHGNSILGDYGCNNSVFYGPQGGSTTPVRANTLTHPSNLVIVTAAGTMQGNKEVAAWWIEANYYVYGSAATYPSDRGLGNILCTFADGHAESIPKATFDKNKEQLLIPMP